MNSTEMEARRHKMEIGMCKVQTVSTVYEIHCKDILYNLGNIANTLK